MSEQGRCKDCRHWGPLIETASEFSVAPDEQSLGRRRCSIISDDERQKLAACVEGGDDLDDYGLWTAPDFGCVLFEPAATSSEPAHQSQK